MEDYKGIFDRVESTLIGVGSANLPADEIRARLDAFKHLEGRTFSDDEYYWILVYVIFYAGFRAAIVDARMDTIRKHFPDYETVAGYRNRKIGEILSDPGMIKNKYKVEACVGNARAFQAILSAYGSFRAYIDSFAPMTSFENLMLLKEELEYRFHGLGSITTYHFLTDIGLPVLKPDRVIRRIFQRLGLLESDQQLLTTVMQGRRFAEAKKHPIRYVDVVFVKYGQTKSADLGLPSGICLEQNPRCWLCGVKDYCEHYAHDASQARAT